MAIRILLVEDDLPTLELMTDVLSSFDVEVLPINDSEEAASLIHREKFEGIFLDLMMPKLDGFRLAKAVRASTRNRTTPIVIVTGSHDRKVMQQAFHAGGNFFLPKPVDRNRLGILLNTTRGAMLANRRGLQRVPVQVELRRDDAKGKPSLWTCNLSERGILMQGDATLQVGQDLTFSFCLPHQSERIVALGVVARMDDQGRAGVSFRHLRQTDRQRIRIYIAQELENNHARDVEFARSIVV
jgi:CheY-like chemotaxis protein